MVDSLSSPSLSSTSDIEMDDCGQSSSPARGQSRQRLLGQHGQGRRSGARLAGLARHTLGLILLLCVVFLWTLGNFLGSSIFADSTYAKPFFLTYLNTSTFMLAMIPNLIRMGYRRHRDRGDLYDTVRSNLFQTLGKRGYRPLSNNDDERIDTEEGDDDSESGAFISKATPGTGPALVGNRDSGVQSDEDEKDKHLGIISTARLSFAFCMLWFSANYFAMSCLQYTTVASVTILTSTSSFWTLLVGAITQTEKFTWRKLLGVAMSFAGILLISKVDLSAQTDADSDAPAATAAMLRREDTFPEKPAAELALGDALALLSAILYGIYTITLKKATLKALPRSINMPLFFGFVGMFNFIFLAPLFPILHFTGLEPFSFPPTTRIWTILIINSMASFASDICWAYAMVLTSPLLVTVGLSLTIPLSLVGEMVLQGHYEGWLYWLGAAIVVGSFLFIDQEEKKEEGSGVDVESQDQRRDMDVAILVAEASLAEASQQVVDEQTDLSHTGGG